MLGLDSNKVPPSSLVSDVIRQDEEYNTDLQLIGCYSMIAWYNHQAAPFYLHGCGTCTVLVKKKKVANWS